MKRSFVLSLMPFLIATALAITCGCGDNSVSKAEVSVDILTRPEEYEGVYGYRYYIEVRNKGDVRVTILDWQLVDFNTRRVLAGKGLTPPHYSPNYSSTIEPRRSYRDGLLEIYILAGLGFFPQTSGEVEAIFHFVDDNGFYIIASARRIVP